MLLFKFSKSAQITILSSQTAGVEKKIFFNVSKNKALKLYEEKSSPQLC